MLFESNVSGPDLIAASVVAATVTLFCLYRGLRYLFRSAGRFVEWVWADNGRKVFAGYLVGGLVCVLGVSTAGFGVSRASRASGTQSMFERDERYKFFTAAGTKIKDGADKAAILSLVEMYDKNSVSASNPDNPYGVPFIFGGIASAIMGICLMVRTNTLDSCKR